MKKKIIAFIDDFKAKNKGKIVFAANMKI
jgi:hypothetical protein